MKDFKIFIGLAAVLLSVYLVAQYNKPAPVDWNPTLYYDHKIPYGTYILFHQLNNIFQGAEIIKTNASIYKLLHDTSFIPGSYIIVSKSVILTKFDFRELVNYIKKGNSVLISSFNYRGFLADTLALSTAYETGKENAELNFVNPALKTTAPYIFNKDVSNEYFDSFDTAKAAVIVKNNLGHATFLSFAFGKGKLLLAANPAVFTNISMLTSQGAGYTARALSYLPSTNRVYWDEFQNGDISEDRSPMRVFFERPALQWAYYLSLFGLLTFVLFEIKRRQRIIPVIEPLKNATLSFVNVVGQVYYEQRNNLNIAQKKILYLLTYLRDKYNLKTNKLDDEFIDKLVNKMGAEKAAVVKLVNMIEYIGAQDKISDKELIGLNQLIEQFYNQSR